MLERNLLAHLKLALLLCLLFASILLRGRLPVPENTPADKPADLPHAGLPVATLQFVSALLLIVGGVYEYQTGIRDLRVGRAFLASDKCVPFETSTSASTHPPSHRPHLVMVAAVSGVVITTCLMLLIHAEIF